MSSTSYIRIQTPDNIEFDGVKAFKHTFAHDFTLAGGKHGARIIRMGIDAFNDNAKPLHAVFIDGAMTPTQQKLVAEYA